MVKIMAIILTDAEMHILVHKELADFVQTVKNALKPTIYKNINNYPDEVLLLAAQIIEEQEYTDVSDTDEAIKEAYQVFKKAFFSKYQLDINLSAIWDDGWEEYTSYTWSISENIVTLSEPAKKLLALI